MLGLGTVSSDTLVLPGAPKCPHPPMLSPAEELLWWVELMTDGTSMATVARPKQEVWSRLGQAGPGSDSSW